MGVLDKFLDAIKLNDDYDDDELLDDSLLEDEDDYEDDFLDELAEQMEAMIKENREALAEAEAAKAELAQIKAGQSRGIVHLRPKLAGYAQPLGADRSRDLPEGSLAQFDKLFYCDAFIMKVRRKDNADNAVRNLPAHKRHRHIQISGAVVNARQDVAVQLYKRVFHSSVSCLES